MDFLSPFQILPILIVDKIVKYLEGRFKGSFILDIDNHDKPKAVLLPLLLVSERWRKAALVSICDNCIIFFDYSTKAVEVKFAAWRAGVIYPRVRKNGVVRRVCVSVPLWKDMCDGTFCEVLVRPQYEGLVFPAAHNLFLHLYKTPDKSFTGTLNSRPASALTPATSEEQVADFVRSFRRLLPSLTSVLVFFASNNGLHSDHEQAYRTLLTEIYQGGIKNLHVSSDATTLVAPNMQVVTGLTKIRQGSDLAYDSFARLAYHNAGTLKELCIRPVTEADWLVLIYNDMETPAIFDGLASLTVIVADTLYTTTWAAINDVNPFPILSTLHVDGGYPFDDNLLFRGNGGTLRSLHLPFSAIARNALCRIDILKRSGVTRMNSIHIGMATDVDKAYLAGQTDLPIEEQVHRMLEVVTALKTNCDMTEVSVYQAILAAPSTAILQHINLCRFGFEMVDVISLISALPSLASVTCSIVGLGASIESIPANDRPSTLHAKHYSLRRNYRKLCVLYAENVSADKVAGVAMLIATMCPNFVHVDIPPTLRKDFSREIAWSTYCRSFKPFAASISRLIYSD